MSLAIEKGFINVFVLLVILCTLGQLYLSYLKLLPCISSLFHAIHMGDNFSTQADLSLRWAHIRFVDFVMSRLIYEVQRTS